MSWQWIIIGLAVLVWILTNVTRSSEEKRRAPRPLRRPNDEPPKAPDKVGQFMEEVDRLRRRNADEQGDPDSRERGFRMVPVPQRRPRPAPPRPRVVPQAVTLRQPVPAPVSPPVIEVVEIPAPAPQTTPPPAPAAAAAPVREMLRNPQMLGTAIVLNEVLGPPRCRRRRPAMGLPFQG